MSREQTSILAVAARPTRDAASQPARRVVLAVDEALEIERDMAQASRWTS